MGRVVGSESLLRGGRSKDSKHHANTWAQSTGQVTCGYVVLENVLGSHVVLKVNCVLNNN